MVKVGLGCGCGAFAALVCCLLVWGIVQLCVDILEGMKVTVNTHDAQWGNSVQVFIGIGQAIFPDFLTEFARSVALFLRYVFTGS